MTADRVHHVAELEHLLGLVKRRLETEHCSSERAALEDLIAGIEALLRLEIGYAI
jgi:hypothetical protein